jgi:transcriptional regulator with XRE-family HTH domain
MDTMLLESPAMLRFDSQAMRRLREEKGLSQTEAARAAGMNASRWNDIECGGRTNVTIETLGKIAAVLACEPSDLLATSDEKKSRRSK